MIEKKNRPKCLIRIFASKLAKIIMIFGAENLDVSEKCLQCCNGEMRLLMDLQTQCNSKHLKGLHFADAMLKKIGIH